jgi:hypothetical protein
LTKSTPNISPDNREPESDIGGSRIGLKAGKSTGAAKLVTVMPIEKAATSDPSAAPRAIPLR